MSAENAQTLDKATYKHKEEHALLQDLEQYQQSILGELSVLANDNNLDNTQVQEIVLNDQLLDATFTAITLPDGTQAYVTQNDGFNEFDEDEATLKVDDNGAIFLQDENGKLIQMQLNPLNVQFSTIENSTSDVPSLCTQLQVVDGVVYLLTNQDDLQEVQDEMPKNDSNDQNDEDKSRSKHECPREDCTKVYSTLHHLRVHERTHTGQRPYLCTHPKCKKSFSTGYSLKAHLRTHTGEKPYKCTNNECDKSFKTSGDLLKHIRTHTGERPFVCPFESCGRSFTTSNIRKVHIRTHTGERPFKCPQPKCGKAFASSTNYKNHIRIHSGEKPYVCSIKNCGRRFTEYSSLYKHHIVHTQEKPYECEICHRQYRQHSTLAMHKKTAHSIVDSDPDSVLDVLLENSAEMIDDQAKELELVVNEHLKRSAQNEGEKSQILLVEDPSQLVTFQTTENFNKSDDDIDIALKDLNINMLLNLDEINRH